MSAFFGEKEAEQPFFSPRTLQAKLKIGAPNDIYEQQADAVADQVVSKLSQPRTSNNPTHNSQLTPPSVQSQSAGSVQEEKLQKKEEIDPVGERVQMKPIFDSATDTPPADDDSVQRKCTDCEKEDAIQRQSEANTVQRTPSGEGVEASPDLANQLSNSKSGGSALPDDTRSSMEAAMGADFSNVRVHTGSEATQMSQSINAQAFTHGNHIYFNEGKYSPSSTEGGRLLAHELTHTVQQGAAVQRKVVSINPAVHAMHMTAIQREQAENEVLQRSWLGDAWGAVTSTVSNAVGSLNPRNALNRVAMNIPGFRLVTVIIGYNPILDQDVPRTAENFIGGFLGLIPGGNLLFEKLQETRAIPQAMEWLETEVATLNITLAYIGSLIRRVIEGISLTDISGSIDRAIAIIREPALRVMRFLGRVGSKIKEFIFKGALQIVGAPVEMVMGILTRAGNVLESIFNDPIGFGRNLINSVVGGIRQFAANAGQHLMSGLIGWLTGALAEAGLQLPQQWDLAGIFSLVAQLLNLTYQSIRAKAVRILGEPTVARLEQVFEFVRDLITHGPIVLWERISEFLGNLQEMVMGGIREFVISRIVQQGIMRLVSMFNPAGALIQAVMAIWNTIQFFIERASQLATFARAVFESISHIASGSLGSAMTWIENAMARSIPVILGFLGRLLGLGNISTQIRSVIERIRRPIDTAIDRVVDWLVAQARRLVPRVRGDGQVQPQPSADNGGSLAAVRQSIESQGREKSQDGEMSRGEADEIAANVRRDNPSVLESISVSETPDSWEFNYIQKATLSIAKKKKIRPDEVRSRLYEKGAEKGSFGTSWNSARENTMEKGIKKLRKDLLVIFSKDDATAETQLKRYHILENRGQANTRTGYFSELVLKYLQKKHPKKSVEERVDAYMSEENFEVDHIEPLAQHWTKSGYNTGDKARWDKTTNPDNLWLISKRANRRLGAVGTDGRVYDYQKPTGEDFKTEN